MFLWSGIFQSKWILSQLNTCIRKKKKPLLSLPSGLEASCQMLFWKKPHSEVVLSLKNNVERRYNLGEQTKGGGESPVSLANIVHCWGAAGVQWRSTNGNPLTSLRVEDTGTVVPNTRKTNRSTDMQRKRDASHLSSHPSSFPCHEPVPFGSPWLLAAHDILAPTVLIRVVQTSQLWLIDLINWSFRNLSFIFQRE